LEESKKMREKEKEEEEEEEDDDHDDGAEDGEEVGGGGDFVFLFFCLFPCLASISIRLHSEQCIRGRVGRSLISDVCLYCVRSLFVRVDIPFSIFLFLSVRSLTGDSRSPLVGNPRRHPKWRSLLAPDYCLLDASVRHSLLFSSSFSHLFHCSIAYFLCLLLPLPGTKWRA